MHDAFAVQISYRHCDLNCIKLDNWFGKSFPGLEDLVEFSTSDEWHDEVKSSWRLEQVLHTDEEGMFAAEQNIFLELGVLHLVVLYKDIFSDNLNGVLLTVNLASRQKHFSKGTTTKQGNKIEVFVFNVAVFTKTNKDWLSASNKFIGELNG